MSLILTRLESVPVLSEGDDLVAAIVQGLRDTQIELQDSDIVAVTQKVVSKSEGRAVHLSTVVPSLAATELAARSAKDPRLVELILRESTEVLRVDDRSIIVRHRLGMICPNAGVDQSNVSPENVEVNRIALLLPLDPDASARRIQAGLASFSGYSIGVIVVDSHGRPFRRGTTGICIGLGGVPAIADLRGQLDIFGRVRHSAVVSVADELASAASLLMGQVGEAYPFVHIRGFPYPLGHGSVGELHRPLELDLFGKTPMSAGH